MTHRELGIGSRRTEKYRRVLNVVLGIPPTEGPSGPICGIVPPICGTGSMIPPGR